MPAPQTCPDPITQLSAVGSDAANGPGVAPPHLLWETLESAFARVETEPPTSFGSPAPTDRRLAGYIAMPITLGLSLLLWVAIVELVLTR